MKIDPKEIKGSWARGWALDIHVISSFPIGNNAFGHLEFETIRSEIGEAIYKLKYHDDKGQVDVIVETVAEFIRNKQELKDVHAIIATLPSNTTRPFQPAVEIAKRVAGVLSLDFSLDFLLKVKSTPVLKNVKSKKEKENLLKGAFRVIDERYTGKDVLLFDDLFDTGATLNEIASVLKAEGKVGKVFVLTLTKTRTPDE